MHRFLSPVYSCILLITLVFSSLSSAEEQSQKGIDIAKIESHLFSNAALGAGTITIFVTHYNKEQLIFYWTQKLEFLNKSQSRRYYDQIQSMKKEISGYISRALKGEEFIYSKSYEGITGFHFSEKLRELMVSQVSGVEFIFDKGEGARLDAMKVSLDEVIQLGFLKQNTCSKTLFNGRSFNL